jgi:hypothetical protein
VLTSVGRSIGEGTVPNRDKIQSVINSVRRQYGIIEQDFENPDTIIDDIIARVLANEFLNAKKREELSTNLLAVKNQKTTTPSDNQPKQSPESKNPVPLELALIMGLMTMIVTSFGVLRFVSAGDSYGSSYRRTLVMMTLMLGLVLLSLIVLLPSPAGQSLLRWLQTR